MNSVIVNLMGGLGNQLFQYAAGRSLALRLGASLKLDHSFLEAETEGKYTKRFFELDVYDIKAERATLQDLAPFLSLRKKDLVSRLKRKIGNTSSDFFQLNENGFQYNPAFTEVSGNVYLHGFWQSEKYFSGIRPALLKEISLKTPLSTNAEALQKKITSSAEPVSIHFRRGDYVNLASASSYHGTTPLDYYNAAITEMKSKLHKPNWFVFSDDIHWVKENFKLENAIYAEGFKGFEDLELMRTCAHHIIANSSFSWWGAWLNPSENKTVIAPKNWFNDSAINTPDLIPDKWQRR